MHAHNLIELKKHAKRFRKIAEKHLGIDPGHSQSLRIISELIRNESYDVACSNLVEFIPISHSALINSKFYFNTGEEIDNKEKFSTMTFETHHKMAQENSKIVDQLLYWYSRERALLLKYYEHKETNKIPTFVFSQSFRNDSGELYLRFNRSGKFVEIGIGEMLFMLESGVGANLTSGELYPKSSRNRCEYSLKDQDIPLPNYVILILKTLVGLPGISMVTYNYVSNPSMQDALTKLGFRLHGNPESQHNNYFFTPT